MTTENTPLHLAILDLNHVWRSSWAANKDEPLSKAFDYTVRAVQRVAFSSKYDAFVCALDSPPYDRVRLDPSYKANRPPRAAAEIEQYKRLLHKLEKMGIALWSCEGKEADDVIATACKHAAACNVDVTIFTADKDLGQLVRDAHPTVGVVSTRNKGETWDEKFIIEKFGVSPAMLGELLALMGDTSDNVKGCPNVGAKTGAKLLHEYGDLNNILAAAGGGKIPGKLGENLNEHRVQIIQSHVLVTLEYDVSIPWSDIYNQKAESRAKAEEEYREAEVAPAAPVTPTPTSTHDIPSKPVFENPVAPEDNPFLQGPTAGDKLVGGALVKQQAAPIEAQAPPATTLAVAPATEVQLRPGLSISAAQMKMYQRMAAEFHAGGLFRRKFESPQAIFSVIMLGVELGVGPQLSLQLFDVVEGRVAPSARYLITQAEQDPNCEYFEIVEDTPDHVTYACKQKRGRGEEKTFTYSMKDAETAGLLGKNTPWKYHPRSMLRARAGSMAARAWFPAATCGLYSQEELGGEPQ